MKKNIFVILLVLISTFNPLPVQASVGGSISGGGTISAGGTFNVSIAVSTDLSAQVIQASIGYDTSKLTILSSSGNSNYSVFTPSTFSFLLDGPTTPQTGNFTIVNLTFQATSAFTAGTSTSITLNSIRVASNSDEQSGGSGSISVNIAQALSSDNTLSALAVDGTSVLSSDGKSVSKAITTDSSSVTITATKNNSNATITGIGSGLALEYGVNTKNVVVTAENGDKRTFSISITRNDTRDSDNTLSSLTVNGTSVPISNSMSINVDTATANVLATATKSTSKVTGAVTKTLEYGSNSFNIVVEAENTSKKTYTLTVIRNDNRSTDNTLSALTINGSSVLSNPIYSTNDASITVAASANDSKATVTGTGVKNLEYGLNTINVVVTAENTSTKTYALKVTRNDNRSTVNTLNSLSVDGKSVSGFSSSKTYYDLGSTDATSISISADKTDAKSTIAGTGTKTLAYGSNTFKVVVTAENSSTKTYTIVINKTDSRDTDSSLSSLTIEGVDFKFNSKELYYYAVVKNSVSSINIKATPTKTTSTVSGTGTKTLAVYDNTFDVVVTAQNGSKTTYSLKIMREDAKGFLGDVSDNNNLSSLTIEGYPIDFKADSLNYELNIPLEVTSLNVQAVAEDEKATVTVNYPEALKLGKNTISIEVLSESFDLKTYTITVIRGADIEALKQEEMATYIDELVAEDLILSISFEEAIDSKLLNTISDMGKPLKIIFTDPSLGNIANWSIDASAVSSISDLVFGMSYGSDFSKQLDELSNYAPKLVLNLDYSGPISSGVFLEANVSSEFVNGDIVTVYRFDPEKNRFYLVDKNVKVIDGWIQFEPLHASEFVISKAEFYTFPISYKILVSIALIQFIALIMVIIVILSSDYRNWFKNTMLKRSKKSA